MSRAEDIIGRTGTVSEIVRETDTAAAVGSGDVDVLATPRLLAWMEAATCAALDGWVDQEQTSVGSTVELEHLRPSRPGHRVDVLARIVTVDGRLIRFDVAATNEDGRECGRAAITRVVVDRSRFA